MGVLSVSAGFETIEVITGAIEAITSVVEYCTGVSLDDVNVCDDDNAGA